MSVSNRKSRVFNALALFSLIFGCAQQYGGDWTPDASTDIFVMLQDVGPAEVISGTTIAFTGTGFVPPDMASTRAMFHGEFTPAGMSPATVYTEVFPAFVSPARMEYQAEAGFLAAFGGAAGVFSGRVCVRVFTGGPQPAAESCLEKVISMPGTLMPALSGNAVQDLHLGGMLSFSGENFIWGGEGTTVLYLTGTFTSEDGYYTDLDGLPVVPHAASRSNLDYILMPDLFGVRPGLFEGSASISNLHSTGVTVDGSGLEGVRWSLLQSELSEVSPAAVSRGQKLFFRGRGFVPTSADTRSATMIRLSGTFYGRDGFVEILEGEDSLEIGADYLSATEAVHIVRPALTPEKKFEGFGADFGTFEGLMAPVVYYGSENVEGEGVWMSLEVAPTMQVVQLKFLPSFYESLDGYGLGAAAAAIEQRIFEVVSRDYAKWNVEVRTEAPQDFEDYCVVEIGGKDPNGRDLMGLDNTEGKDEGNLRLNDYIGGRNAETEAKGLPAYGGVFIESFFGLSPTGTNPMPIASPAFDDIFNPFISSRGGSPVVEGEYPGGGRDAAISEAIRVLGNLAGNTASHEIGHTLGLALGAYYHNMPPGDNLLMDDGIERPFEERAELFGMGPEKFTSEQEQYLDGILGK